MLCTITEEYSNSLHSRRYANSPSSPYRDYHCFDHAQISRKPVHICICSQDVAGNLLRSFGAEMAGHWPARDAGWTSRGQISTRNSLKNATAYSICWPATDHMQTVWTCVRSQRYVVWLLWLLRAFMHTSRAHVSGQVCLALAHFKQHSRHLQNPINSRL